MATSVDRKKSISRAIKSPPPVIARKATPSLDFNVAARQLTGHHYCRLVNRNVLDRASVAVKDHLVREPVNLLVAVFVDVRVTDIDRTQGLCLG